ASNASGRQIVIAGDLKVHPWSLTPEFLINDLHVGNPARYAQRGEFATVAHANVAVRLLPLLVGRFDIVRLDLLGAEVPLYRNSAGDGNWAPDPNPGHARPFDLPAIQRFSMHDGRMRYVDDKRKMVLNAAFTSEESAEPSNRGAFTLTGDGTLNGRPF